MKIIDISRPIHTGMPTYKGNPDVKVNKTSALPNDSCNFSELTMGLHTGSHIDAPAHYINGGKNIHELPVTKFLGPCIVVDLSHLTEKITEEDLHGADIKEDDIVLLKTRNSLTLEYTPDYIYITEKAALYLAGLNIKAIGIDTFKFDKSGTNAAHKAVLAKEIPIIEGVVLKDVNPGRYEFIGLPLKIHAEAAPCRAILLQR